MDLQQLSAVCGSVLASFSENSMCAFINYLDRIKDLISNSKDNYLNKLNSLKNVGVFKSFNEILQNPISSEDQLKLLRFYDFIIETCSLQEEILVLFADGITNNLLSYPFELSSIDVLQSYMTILKGISMKANLIPSQYLYLKEQERCPLFDHAIAYISHNDSTTIAAARLVVLNLFLSKNPEILELISQPATKNQIEHLISVIDSDGFAFLVDLMNVAPLEITQFTIEKLRVALMENDAAFFARALLFLSDSRAKSMIMETLAAKLCSFKILEPIPLGIILFCLDKHLILSDAAVNSGLIRSGSFTPIPRFLKKTPKTPTRAKMFQELAYVVQHRESTVVLALSLRIFEKLSAGPPKIITSVKHDIIKQLNENMTAELAELLSCSLMHRQRTDLDYLLSERREIKKSKQYTLLAQLSEVEASLYRWNKLSFGWFKLAESQETGYQPFGIQDGGTVTLTANELIVGGGQKYRLWDISVIPNENKMHKIVTIRISGNKSWRKSLVLDNKETIVFEFHSFPVAMQFEGEITLKQKELCRLTLAALEQNT